MKLQDRYDTALKLVLSEYHITQKDLSEILMGKEIPNGSNGQLSNAKSKVDKKTGNKYRDGDLNDQKLFPIVKELESMLEEKKIHLASDRSHYFRGDGSQRFDPIFLNKVQIKLPYHIDGIVAIHDLLPKQHLQDTIKKAKKIRLLQTFMPSMDDYEASFKYCLQNGGSIQILLLDPRGTSAKVRSRGFGKKGLNVEQAVLENFKTLVGISPGFGRLEIKFYDEFPGVDMISCDQLMFCGWYLHQQLAKNGCYLELVNNNQYTLSRNINQSWESIWAVATPANYTPQWPSSNRSIFRCHYLRNGKYYNYDMHINRVSNEVFLTNTPSKEEFRGHFENDRGRFLYVSVATINKFVDGLLTEIQKRSISILIYTGLTGLWEQQLSVGVSANVTLDGALGGNLMLIENISKRSGRHMTELEFTQLKMYLSDSEISAEDISPHDFGGLRSFLQRNFFQWEEKQKSLEKIHGKFHLFYECKDGEGKKCICRRQLEIFGSERYAEREIWKENRTHRYKVSISNHHHILLQSIKEDILGSELIYLQRVPPDWKNFSGLIYFIAVDPEWKQHVAPALLCRTERGIGDKGYTIYPGSPYFQNLMKQKYFQKTFGYL